MYAVDNRIDNIIKGNATNKNFAKEIRYPSFAAIPATITFALAPTNVPFPPRHAPRARLHHIGSKLLIPIVPISLIIGIVVATNGILSIKAEAIALIQSIKIEVEATSPPVKLIE